MLRRLLAQRPCGMTLYELAQAIDVTPRSMRRYLKEIAVELELEPTPTRAGGPLRWRVRASDLPRRIALRRTQTYALLAARRLFEPMRGSALFEEVDLAIQQLMTIANRPGRGPNAGLADVRLEDRFLYLPVAPKDYSTKTEELDDLFQSVADLRPLKCRYKSGRDGDEETVVIHPYALVLYKDAVYCVGLHTAKGEVRTFLLDRMRDTETSTLERFELPQGFNVDDHFQAGFGIFRSSRKTKVTLEFDAKVADLARSRRINETQKVVDMPNGGVRLTAVVGELTELVSWVLGWGKTVKVIEPEELAAKVRLELEAALAKYA
jgi:predicted DNA-binding transcriptional regulator YafY